MKINNLDLDFYLSKMRKNKTFSFSRWGDGEWLCVSGKTGANCDGHEYFPELSFALRKCLSRDLPYFKAAFPKFQGRKNLVFNCIKNYSNVKEWVDAKVWMNSFLEPNKPYLKLINQLNSMNFIMVSDSSKYSLKNTLDMKGFIEIPPVNCFLNKDRIKDMIIEHSKKHELPVFGLSASMTSNAIIDELYSEIGEDCWMIDFGSIWDPLCGNRSRVYHKGYNVK
jgi:hypothetical protein